MLFFRVIKKIENEGNVLTSNDSQNICSKLLLKIFKDFYENKFIILHSIWLNCLIKYFKNYVGVFIVSFFVGF